MSARLLRILIAPLLVLAACASEAIDISDELSIPVLWGSHIPTSCDAVVDRDLTRDTTEYGCVAMPLGSQGVDGKDWDSDYVDELKADGWQLVSGAANIYWFEKPADENCNYKMGMMGTLENDEDWNLYLQSGQPDIDAVLVYVFFNLPEKIVCGADREFNGNL